MTSRNLIALQEGRITPRDFDRMAVHKFRAYNNCEDLDVERDYNHLGLQKLTPTVRYTPAAKDYPGVVAELYQVFRHEVEEEYLREACHEYDDGSVLVPWTYVWYWVPWGMSGGDFLYLKEALDATLSYPGQLEVVDACDSY